MEDKNTFEEKFTVPCSFQVKELKKTIEKLHSQLMKQEKYG